MSSGPIRFNAMHPLHWIPLSSRNVLDVGCNVGELLSACAEHLPSASLAGVDISARAVASARERVHGADIRLVSGSKLPFPDASFDCVTCIEMLEHVPPGNWNASLAEIYRVLAPGGRLILRCPHAGLFSWLDVANLRHRFPVLYRVIVGRGIRDEAYPGGAQDIVWHHHFSQTELRSLIPAGLEVECVRQGGMLIFPLTDYLLFPFYRARRYQHPAARTLARLSEWDYGIDYGRWSYGILMVARRNE